MRLINADLLEIETQSLEDVGQGEIQFYSVEQIDNAPTVLTIPDNPTNGDVLQAVFPCDEVYINEIQEGVVHFLMKSNPTSMDCFNTDWWNAPYKENKDGKIDR